MAKKLYRYEITVTLSVRAESRAEAYEVAKLAKMELPEALAREHYLFGTCKMARAKMRAIPKVQPDA